MRQWNCPEGFVFLQDCKSEFYLLTVLQLLHPKPGPSKTAAVSQVYAHMSKTDTNKELFSPCEGHNIISQYYSFCYI